MPPPTMPPMTAQPPSMNQTNTNSEISHQHELMIHMESTQMEHTSEPSGMYILASSSAPKKKIFPRDEKNKQTPRKNVRAGTV